MEETGEKIYCRRHPLLLSQDENVRLLTDFTSCVIMYINLCFVPYYLSKIRLYIIIKTVETNSKNIYLYIYIYMYVGTKCWSNTAGQFFPVYVCIYFTIQL